MDPELRSLLEGMQMQQVMLGTKLDAQGVKIAARLNDYGSAIQLLMTNFDEKMRKMQLGIDARIAEVKKITMDAMSSSQNSSAQSDQRDPWANFSSSSSSRADATARTPKNPTTTKNASVLLIVLHRPLPALEWHRSFLEVEKLHRTWPTNSFFCCVASARSSCGLS
mmetsp:Transcript_105565/g.303488  ORF Transcript_105565/g.303488 Transcript_105565/m.303488 type:complete len:167 (+) Transcript_105565:125-625(+)